jgi:hypothetical protein
MKRGILLFAGTATVLAGMKWMDYEAAASYHPERYSPAKIANLWTLERRIPCRPENTIAASCFVDEYPAGYVEEHWAIADKKLVEERERRGDIGNDDHRGYFLEMCVYDGSGNENCRAE